MAASCDGCGCFCWALPLSLLVVCFVFLVGLLSNDETQIWLGDLRVVGVCGHVCVRCCQVCDHCVIYVSFLLDASLSVRTEPCATSAEPEEKKRG